MINCLSHRRIQRHMHLTLKHTGKVCAASEAGVERFFSTEGLFHDDVRSSISPVITKAVIHTHWNHNLVKRQYVREFPMDVEFDE